MNKQTKIYVGAALLAVAGYMVWKKMQDKKAAAVPPKQFAGMKKIQKFKKGSYGGSYGEQLEQSLYAPQLLID